MKRHLNLIKTTYHFCRRVGGGLELYFPLLLKLPTALLRAAISLERERSGAAERSAPPRGLCPPRLFLRRRLRQGGRRGVCLGPGGCRAMRGGRRRVPPAGGRAGGPAEAGREGEIC